MLLSSASRVEDIAAAVMRNEAARVPRITTLFGDLLGSLLPAVCAYFVCSCLIGVVYVKLHTPN
ncbi:MAG: hypothetical protein ACR2G5_07025 [Pyrinomonadaceae bacterium]